MSQTLTNQVHKFSRALVLLLTCVGCAGGDRAGSSSTVGLPAQVVQADLVRKGDVRLFAGDSLWEYINGGAEIYHQYHFIQVATADYTQGSSDFVIDLYDFRDSLSTYGLYTAIRPPGTSLLDLGMAGFGSPTSVDFVKGQHLVRITAFESSPEVEHTMQAAAQELAVLVPGTSQRPAVFGLFPADQQISATDRYYTTSFLGQQYLAEVFSQSYLLGSDTLTLFLCEVNAESAFSQWQADLEGKATSSPDLPLEQDRSLQYSDSYRGTVVAGLKGDRLVGVINYSESHLQWCTAWLNSLP